MSGFAGKAAGCVLGVLILVLAGSAQCPAESFPIRIGEINPLTGKLAKHGIEIHEGILLAVEQANAKGGVQGHRLELISRDDQSQPEVAVNQAEELLFREKVVGLVGGYVDSLVGPISHLAAKYHVPYVASASLQRALTKGRSNPFFFRVSDLDGIVKPLSGFLLQDPQPKNVALLYASTPGATELSRELRQNLSEGHVPVAIFEKYRPGTPDFSSFLLKIRQANVDALIVCGFFPDHLILVRQIRDLKIPLKAYIGPWGIAYPAFIQIMGAASENLIGMCAWSPEITLPGTEKASAQFVEAFQKRFKTLPDTTSMHGYTSARALIDAIGEVLEAGLELTGSNLSSALRNLDVVLPMERLKFDAAGDPCCYEQVIVQIQGGRTVSVYPPQRARGEVLPLDNGS